MIKRFAKKVLGKFKIKKFTPMDEVNGNQKHPIIQQIISNSTHYIRKLYHERGAKFNIENDKDFFIEIDDLKIKITCFEELFIVNEVFNELVYSFIISDDIIVIDIGSNIGTAVLYFNKYENVKKIVGFEPVYDTFKRLEENLAINKNPSKISVNNYGLGNSNKDAYFEFSNEYKGSVGVAGLDEYKRNRSKDVKKVKVQIRDCKEVFEEILSSSDVKNILLKIDCEGGEYEIIPRLYEAGLLKRIKYIVMEWHGDEYKELLKFFSSYNCFFHRETPTTGMLYGIQK